MTYRKIFGLAHISKLATKNGGEVEVFVRKANNQLLEYWHSAIQPIINQTEVGRADIGWNWPVLTATLSPFASILKQKHSCYTIGMKLEEKFMPCALIFMAENYPHLPERTKACSFIWFMAAAPEEVYQKNGLGNSIPKLGTACLDVGVTTSFNNSNDGLMGLHASPEGKERLVEFYQKQGMSRLAANKKISLMRKNDGRYFFYDSIGALHMSRSCDIWR